MSRKSQTYTAKKQSSLVHKPFEAGQVNLFHPPKKNPNGHLASSQLWHDNLSKKLPDAAKASPPKNQDLKLTNFLSTWKFAAILIIIGSNLIAATAILIQKRQANLKTLTEAKQQQIYTAGKTDLASQEFIELDLNNLKNIAVSNSKNSADTTLLAKDSSIANLPLAIPPQNLPQNIVLPQTAAKTKYYYILAQYTGDRSLEIAKTKVPHVSLVNFPQGMFIYMGAFTDKNLAHNFVEQLQEFNLESYVYPFD